MAVIINELEIQVEPTKEEKQDREPPVVRRSSEGRLGPREVTSIMERVTQRALRLWAH